MSDQEKPVLGHIELLSKSIAFGEFDFPPRSILRIAPVPNRRIAIESEIVSIDGSNLVNSISVNVRQPAGASRTRNEVVTIDGVVMLIADPEWESRFFGADIKQIKKNLEKTVMSILRKKALTETVPIADAKGRPWGLIFVPGYGDGEYSFNIVEDSGGVCHIRCFFLAS